MTHGRSPGIERLAPELARAIGAVLREERRAKRLRQAQLSDVIGIVPTTVSRIERGRECPTLPMFVLLASGVCVPAPTLLERAVNHASVKLALLEILQAARPPPNRR